MKTSEDVDPLVYIIAGEPSGDLIASRLMAALKKKTDGKIRFQGIGGELMHKEGSFKSIFPMHELSVMGLVEILPHLPNLLRRIKETEKSIKEVSADVLVTIDSPEFNFRICKKLKNSVIPIVHYVAPQVWAWRPGRAKKLSNFLDNLLLLFSFEQKYFDNYNLKTTFVGHPILEEPFSKSNGIVFREKHKIGKEDLLLSILPGSRKAELVRHLPIFSETVTLLRERYNLKWVVVPAIPKYRELVESKVQRWDVNTIVVDAAQNIEKFSGMLASDAALTSAGTATLELARAQVPMVVTYRAHPITFAVAKRLVTIPHVALVNIIADQHVVPEYLQKNCKPEILASAVGKMLIDKIARNDQMKWLEKVSSKLGDKTSPPSHLAAEVILKLIQQTEPISGRL